MDDGYYVFTVAVTRKACYNYYHFDAQSGECVLDCPEHCATCHKVSETDENTPPVCDSCVPTYFLYEFPVRECKQSACPPGCTSCQLQPSGEYYCWWCYAPYLYSYNCPFKCISPTALDVCADGKIGIINEGCQVVCRDCTDPNCKTCKMLDATNQNYDKCDICNDGYYFDVPQNRCL